MVEKVEAALAGLRQGIQADGGDLVIDDVRDSVVHIRLLLGDEACAECVLPPPMLERVVESQIKKAVPEISSVNLIDPRKG